MKTALVTLGLVTLLGGLTLSTPAPAALTCEQAVTQGVMEQDESFALLVEAVEQAEAGGSIEALEQANGHHLNVWTKAGDRDELACGGYTEERDRIIDQLMEQGHGYDRHEWMALTGRAYALGVQLY